MKAGRSWASLAPELAAALDHHRAGRLDRASTLYRRILDKAPDHPDALHMLGVIAISRGRPEHAIQLIGRAMGALATFPDAHLNLGNAQRNAGRRAEAIACYRSAIALKPDFAAAHSSLGRELNASREFAAALANCRQAIASDPAMPEAWLHAGAALHGLGRLGEAEPALRQALALRPDFVEPLQILGVIAVETSRFEQAVDWQRRLVALRPTEPSGYRALGVSLFRAGQTDAALKQLRRAVELAPGFAPGWTSLGWAYRALGRFDEAVSCFERALAADPDSAEARRSLVATGRRQANEDELRRLAAVLADAGRHFNERAAAGFARGTLLDQAERFDEAFACFAEANALARRTLVEMGRGYDAGAMRRRIDRLIADCTPDMLAATAAAGNASERPVFIVGMPRSGTTLVEQIAASHPLVFGAGELTDIARIAGLLPPASGGPEAAARWVATARPLGDAHLARLARVGGSAERVTDKQPDNLLNLGLIAALFPAARIVLCERDPRDICLSNYFQLFAGGNPWSYALEDCGQRYREVSRLTEHWRRVLPLAMHTVRYEALVGDLEGETRRLLAFLGLEWEPACLEFHRTERTVITQSTWQVRQRLFTHSVGRWCRYERHLGPLLAALGDLSRAGPRSKKQGAAADAAAPLFCRG